MPYEPISILDIFKIGIGPSSSHTLGPWRAAQRFTRSLREEGLLFEVSSLEILLYGSLAKTGKGHGTDIAIQLGLSGEDPVRFPTDQIDVRIREIAERKKIILEGEQEIDFDPAKDIKFLLRESLPFHPNALSFLVNLKNGGAMAETYYSVGGGFVIKDGEQNAATSVVQLPFPINTASDLLHWCMKTGMGISEVVMENEGSWRNETETRAAVQDIGRVMRECIFKGAHTEGILPGGLNVKRRACQLNTRLLGTRTYSDFDSLIMAIRT